MTWLQRLQAERDEVKDRRDKLLAMLDNPAPQISPGQYRLMVIQETTMAAYIAVLEARLMLGLEEQ